MIFIKSNLLEIVSNRNDTVILFSRDLRFMCTFRFKLWWMTQRMGSNGRDIPFETQFLLIEGRKISGLRAGGSHESVVYTVFLPVLEGAFRAVLQGNSSDELEICLESGNCSTVIESIPILGENKRHAICS
jgi:Raffinose synthase or seed imbibition protein Sip1